MTRDGDFWTRRRAAVQAESEAEEARRLAISEADEQADLSEETDEAILAKLELPDPDAMEAGDDFSKFMAKAVPERLRRRALRKLWLTNPVLANVDGLLDYGEDFTDSALAVPDIQTAYQVGKGMLKHVLEMERQQESEDGEKSDGAEKTDEIIVAETEVLPVDETQEPAAEDDGEVFEATPTPRRMQFTFEDSAA